MLAAPPSTYNVKITGPQAWLMPVGSTKSLTTPRTTISKVLIKAIKSESNGKRAEGKTFTLRYIDLSKVDTCYHLKSPVAGRHLQGWLGRWYNSKFICCYTELLCKKFEQRDKGDQWARAWEAAGWFWRWCPRLKKKIISWLKTWSQYLEWDDYCRSAQGTDTQVIHSFWARF